MFFIILKKSNYISGVMANWNNPLQFHWHLGIGDC